MSSHQDCRFAAPAHNGEPPIETAAGDSSWLMMGMPEKIWLDSGWAFDPKSRTFARTGSINATVAACP